MALSACTTEKIVFKDREPFNPPPDAASGFLGYYTVSSKQTSCGNCHVGQQTKWAQTRHASAYKTLADLCVCNATGPTRRGPAAITRRRS